jgi:hypothetical protein
MAYDISDFEEAPATPVSHDISDYELAPKPSSDLSDFELAPKESDAATAYSELVNQAAKEGRPVIFQDGKPTIGEKPKEEPLSIGDKIVQGAESGLGTAALKIGAGASRLLGQKELADSLSTDADQWKTLQPADTASKIGTGIGGAASLIASGGLPGAIANVGLQSQAEKLSFSAALKTAPEFAAYWLLGMGAGKAVAPLISQSSPLIKTLASGAAATLANIASSSAIRVANGQHAAPDAESLAQDALFGFGVHGMEAGKKAALDHADVSRMLETAPDYALQMAASDPDFRKSAPYDPKLIDKEIARRATAELAPKTAAVASLPPLTTSNAAASPQVYEKAHGTTRLTSQTNLVGNRADGSYVDNEIHGKSVEGVGNAFSKSAPGNPLALVVSYIKPDGTVVNGSRGQIHLTMDDPYINHEGSTPGFTDKFGRFLTREEAAIARQIEIEQGPGRSLGFSTQFTEGEVHAAYPSDAVGQPLPDAVKAKLSDNLDAASSPLTAEQTRHEQQTSTPSNEQTLEQRDNGGRGNEGLPPGDADRGSASGTAGSSAEPVEIPAAESEGRNGTERAVGEPVAGTAEPADEVSPIRRIFNDVHGDNAAAIKAPEPVAEAIRNWRDKGVGLMSLFEAGKRFSENAPHRDIIAAKFDAANNLAGYVARQARRHVELAGEGKAPSSEEATRQRAATFIRQANGDKAGMLGKLNAIKGKGYDAAILYAEKHWDSLEKIAEAAKEATDAAHDQAKAAGATLDYRDNYVKGAYEDVPNRKVVFDETGGGGTGSSFKKAKVFNDYAEAIAAGFKPKELRLDVLTESAVNSMLKTVNRNEWANSLGDIKVGDQSAVAPLKENGSPPDGYTLVQVSPGKNLAILNDLAPTVKALTAESAVPKFLSNAASTVKHNILVFDIFHASRFAQMQGAFEGRIPSYHKGLSLLEYADGDLASAQKRGLITASEALWAKANRPKLEALVRNGLNAGKISDALFSDSAALMPGTKQVNSFIFDKLSRGIITESAIYALERNAKNLPKMSESDLLRYTAKEVNTYYRNLGSQGIFKSKTFQDLARFALLAPQWTEGLIRSEARGYGQLAKAPFEGKVGNIGKGVGTGLVAYLAFTQLINMLTRGQPTWKNPEPGHKLDAWIPDVMQGSNGYFISPLSVFAETTHDAVKYIERGKSPADVPGQLLDNKLSPGVRAFRDLVYGKDFYGRPLEGFDRVTQAAKEVAPIPLFARSGGYKGGAERQLVSSLGIKATTAPSSTSDIYQLLSQFKEAHGLKPTPQSESAYAPLRNALRDGDLDAAQKELEKVRASMTNDLTSASKAKAKVDAYFNEYARRPFSGSSTLESKFRSSLDRGQMDIYNRALRERQEISRAYRSLKR